MIAYFDASALAKRYVREERTDEVMGWLEGSTATTSRVSEIEIASALARRFREGTISRVDRDRALAALAEDLESLSIIELSPVTAAEARGVLLRHPLRAADALQLASALTLRRKVRAPIHFVAFDERLAGAAQAEGLLGPPRLD